MLEAGAVAKSAPPKDRGLNNCSGVVAVAGTETIARAGRAPANAEGGATKDEVGANDVSDGSDGEPAETV